MAALTIDPELLPQSIVEQSVFEGLFHLLLAPEGEFAAELRAAGYDLAAPLPQYPGKVFQDCLRIARRRAYPDLPPEEAERALGKRFLDGYFATIVGRLIAAVLPIVGTSGALKRYARFYKSGSVGTVVTSEPLGERCWRVCLRDRFMNVDFNHGLLEAALLRTGVQPTVVVAGRSPYGADYQAQW